MNHNQDWEPVVLRGQAQHQAAAQQKHRAAAANAPGTAALRKLEDTDAPMKRRQLTPESRQDMIQRRAAGGFTQIQLNQRCSFPANTIREIEAGRLCPSPQQISIINRQLSCKLVVA
jgi:ribosome-binding protein aMBF1 (putative translation factor)